MDRTQPVENSFIAANGERFTVSALMIKALLQYLGEVYPDSVPLGELRQFALQRLASSADGNSAMQSQA